MGFCGLFFLQKRGWTSLTVQVGFFHTPISEGIPNDSDHDHNIEISKHNALLSNAH